MRLLLELNEITADSKDYMGDTLLSVAARNEARTGCEAVMRILLKRNDVAADSKNRSGQTPLWWAAGCATGTMVEM